MDDGLGAADDESLVTLKKILGHFGKRLRPIGAELMTRVVDEHQVAVRQQRLVAYGRGPAG